MDFCFGLCSCSPEPKKASNTDIPAVESRKEEFDLEGVGKVLSSFYTRGYNFDIDYINPGNHHNESNVTHSCYSSNAAYFLSEPVSRDATIIAGNRIGEKDYELSVTMNTESGTLMWKGDVTTHFHYNAADNSWHMSSSVTEDEAERPYAYCDAAAAFDILIESLECYAANSEETAAAAAVKMLTESIKGQRESILSSGLPLYQDAEENDCEGHIDSKTYATRWDGMY